MNDELPPMCYFCTRSLDGEGWRCAAFPDGVPSKILKGFADHRKPVAGDRGIQFELNPAADQSLFSMIFPANSLT